MSDGILKAIAIRATRAVAAPFGRRAVDDLVRKGLPQRFGGPLRFLFGDPRAIDDRVREVARGIEALRAALGAREGGVPVLEQGFQSPDSRRPFHEIASLSSVPQEWGTFLHLLARAIDARFILELGACAGISGCYLASVPTCERFVSIEGSPPLASIASEHLARVSSRASVVNGVFEQTLDGVLSQFSSGIDFTFVDGHKDADALRAPVKRIVERLSSGGLLVLDDIRAYAGTARLWAEICGWPGFSHAVDVGRFGFCVRDPSSARPRVARLAVYTAWLRRS
jgi:predicted O-methyltransferase YrrM